MEHIKCKYKGLKLIIVGRYYLKLIEWIHCVKTSVLIKAHHWVIISWKKVKIMGVTSIIICLVFHKCFYHARLPVQQSILWHYRSHFIPKLHIPQTGKYENEWTFNRILQFTDTNLNVSVNIILNVVSMRNVNLKYRIYHQWGVEWTQKSCYSLQFSSLTVN